jgi:hypothetical protein
VKNLSTPDITPVQKLGAALMILMGATWPVLEAFDVGLTDAQSVAIGGFVTAFVSVAVAADAIIRNGRSRVAAAKVEAKKK